MMKADPFGSAFVVCVQRAEIADLCESAALLSGTKNEKHKEGGDDDADDDEDQGWAGETRPLLRRWGRRRHFQLDADLCFCGSFGEELPHGRSIFSEAGGAVFLQGVLANCGGRSWFFDGEIVVD
jgi:hypothetical protein